MKQNINYRCKKGLTKYLSDNRYYEFNIFYF